MYFTQMHHSGGGAVNASGSVQIQWHGKNRSSVGIKLCKSAGTAEFQCHSRTLGPPVGPGVWLVKYCTVCHNWNVLYCFQISQEQRPCLQMEPQCNPSKYLSLNLYPDDSIQILGSHGLELRFYRYYRAQAQSVSCLSFLLGLSHQHWRCVRN